MSNPSLLDSLIADALTSDYPRGPGPITKHSPIRIVSILIGTLATFTLTLGLVHARESASENLATKEALIERVQRADGRVSALEGQVKQAQLDVKVAEQAHLSNTSLGDIAQQRLEKLRRVSGFTEVKGPGLEVLLDDAPKDVTEIGTDSPGRVQDRDVQMVVNGLWQSGATAIAINGRRLTTTSAIRSAGEAILVDYRPLVRPYRIHAIGTNADALAGRFRDNAAGLLLEELNSQFGVVWELTTLGDTTIPAATTSGGQP